MTVDSVISAGRTPAEITLSGKKWRRLASALWHPLEIRPQRPDFSTDLHLSDLGASSLARVGHTACQVHRSLKGISKSDTDSVIYIHNTGGAAFAGHQAGRSVVVQPGGAAFLLSGAPYELSFGDATEVLVLQTPRAAIALSPERLGAASARAAAPGAGPARVLAGLLNGILDASPARPGRPGPPHHAVADLLSWSLDDIARTAGFEESGREHVYREIRAHISEHPDIASITPDSIAASFFMSRRSLYQLFAEHGATPRATIREEALSRSRALLLDRSRSVGDVAVLVGFDDATAFTRAFRRHYGSPPGSWRTLTAGSAPA